MNFEVFIQVFNSNYYISNFGRVYNSKSKKTTLSPEGKGKYARVRINSKKYRVHRLVASIFIPNPDNKPFVDHIDGDRYNNRADNLRWVTSLENNRHLSETTQNYRNLKESDIKYIKNSKLSNRKLALKFKITVPQVRKIKEK